MLLGLLFSLLISNSFAIQNINEVCSFLSICDNIAVIRSQVEDIKEEQERQKNILKGSSVSEFVVEPTSDLPSKTNNEVCTILSICSNLAALSSELAFVRTEQERQADLLEETCQKEIVSYPANCYEALKESQTTGVTEILVPECSNEPFKVACDQESYGGGWTIILRRTDGSEDFYREWKDYEMGFGQVDGEYFVGLEKMHKLTYAVPQEMLVIVAGEEGEQCYAIYDNFRVGAETKNYTLESVGDFSGTAGDALTYHLGMQFSTKDRDNDIDPMRHCAIDSKGAWWYRTCFYSNLAGRYDGRLFLGPLRWIAPKFNKSLKTAIMMIRPRVGTLKR